LLATSALGYLTGAENKHSCRQKKKRHPQFCDRHQAWDSFPLPRYKICKIPMRQTDNPVTSSNGMHVFCLIHLSFAHYTSWDVSRHTNTTYLPTTAASLNNENFPAVTLHRYSQ